jgi:hypothetical protein
MGNLLSIQRLYIINSTGKTPGKIRDHPFKIPSNRSHADEEIPAALHL